MTAALSNYTDLVPSANADKPNFIAALEALLQPFVDIQNVVESLTLKYDVDEAVGMQLDVCGQWIGFGRRVIAPISGVYFSLDIAGVGLDEGVWWAPGDPLTELVTLPDDIYRLMLYAKIASNYWDGSLAQLQEIFATFFAVSPGTKCFVVDNLDMTMTVAIAGAIPGEIYQRLFINTKIPFPPAAVGSNVIVTTESGAPIFGLDIDNDYVGGFDHGAWYAAVA